MSVKAAPGTPQYSGTFIPSVWSSKLIAKYYDATVLAAISNTDYEGEIKNQGDKVYIRTTPTITIRKYNKNSKLQVERPESDNVELQVDEANYFACVCDDVDKVQSDIDLLNDWTTDASEQMKIALDTEILNILPADAHAANAGAAAGRKSGAFNLGSTGAPVSIDKTTVLDYIVDSGTVLDEQNIPETDRWMVIPAWMAGMIKKSDLKDASLTGDGKSILRNGRIGQIDRFTLYLSNCLNPVIDGANSCYNILFGHRVALTFASQMTKMETLRASETFGDIVRGIQVYGYKTVKPDGLGALYARKG